MIFEQTQILGIAMCIFGIWGMWVVLDYDKGRELPNITASRRETKTLTPEVKDNLSKLHSALYRLMGKLGTELAIEDISYLKIKNNCIRLATQTKNEEANKETRHFIEYFEYSQKAYLDAVFSGHTNNAETIVGNAKIMHR